MTAPREAFPSTPDPDVLTLRSATDLLALVPYCLGYRPEESLVVLSLRPRGRSRGRSLGMTARVDLVDVQLDPGVCGRLASHLARDGAEGVFIALYTTGPDDEVLWMVDRLTAACESWNVLLLDAIRVGATSWRSIVCQDPQCCPEEERSLHEVETSVVGPEMVLRGTALAAARSGRLAHLGGTDPARVQDVMGRVATTLRNCGPTVAGQRCAFAAWRRLVAGAQSARDRGSASPQMSAYHAALLAAAMSVVRFRDALLVDVALNWRDGLQPLLEDLDEVAGVFDGVTAPDRLRVDAARQVLADVVRSTEGSRRADVLAALAWVEWYAGDLGLARDVAEQALDADPQQSMAALVVQLSEAGVPPGWARSQDLAASA